MARSAGAGSEGCHRPVGGGKGGRELLSRNQCALSAAVPGGLGQKKRRFQPFPVRLFSMSAARFVFQKLAQTFSAQGLYVTRSLDYKHSPAPLPINLDYVRSATLGLC